MAARRRALAKASEGRITVYLDADLARALRTAGQERTASASAIVSLALREHFARKPPAGYQAAAVDPTDPAAGGYTLAQARRRAQELEAEGVPYRAIASRLRGEGYRTERGRQWSPVTVARMLRALRGGRRKPGRRQAQGRDRRPSSDVESLPSHIAAATSPAPRRPTRKPTAGAAPLRTVLDAEREQGGWLCRLQCGHDVRVRGRRPAERMRCSRCELGGCVCRARPARRCLVHGLATGGAVWRTATARQRLARLIDSGAPADDVAAELNRSRYLTRPSGRPWTARGPRARGSVGGGDGLRGRERITSCLKPD